PVGSLDGEDPDDLHFSEATGNAGVSFERAYLRAALVLWANDRFDEVCASAGIEAAVARLEQRVEEALAEGESGGEAGVAISRLARLVADRWPGYGNEGTLLTKFLALLARFSDAELIGEAMEDPLAQSYDGGQNAAL